MPLSFLYQWAQAEVLSIRKSWGQEGYMKVLLWLGCRSDQCMRVDESIWWVKYVPNRYSTDALCVYQSEPRWIIDGFYPSIWNDRMVLVTPKASFYMISVYCDVLLLLHVHFVRRNEESRIVLISTEERFLWQSVMYSIKNWVLRRNRMYF